MRKKIVKNVYTIWYTFGKSLYLPVINPNVMVIVSSREFRANQRKYFDLAKSNDVVITSRNHGDYKLIPVTNNDMVVDGDILQARISKGIADYERGKNQADNKY